MDCSTNNAGVKHDGTDQMLAECGKLEDLGQESAGKVDTPDNGFEDSILEKKPHLSASLEHSLLSCEVVTASEQVETSNPELNGEVLPDCLTDEGKAIIVSCQAPDRRAVQEGECSSLADMVTVEREQKIMEPDVQEELKCSRCAGQEAIDEAFKRQQVDLQEALEKLNMQSRFLESGSNEANQANYYIELEQSYQHVKQKLEEKENVLKAFRDSHEQLRNSFRSKEGDLQREKEEIISALEASEIKSEEQGMKLRELEIDLARFKGVAAHLEKRCATAESKAQETSCLLDELQSKLECTTTELFELRNSNAPFDAMRMRLQECELSLSKATSQKAVEEKSLKLREEHLEEIEEQQKSLQDRLKWRNEQFQSLEEAHLKLRTEFKESSSEWNAERVHILADIDALQGRLDTKERHLQELQNQLQMVHQALSHEESRRKVLELQDAESRQGLEQATAGYEAAQSAIEMLREQTSTEIGTLRNSLAAKDRQLKDLTVQHLHMEQEFKELKDMEEQYRAWQSEHGEQQQQLLSMKERMASVLEAHDNFRSQIQQQAQEFEKDRRELVSALDLANDNLTLKDRIVEQLQHDLSGFKDALDHVKGQRSSLDIELKECKEDLTGALEVAAMARDALTVLEKSSSAEKSSMIGALGAKDNIIQDLKVQMRASDHTIAELSKNEDKWMLMERDYQMLQESQTRRDVDRKELGKRYDALLQRVHEQEKAFSAGREELLKELQLSQDKVSATDTQVQDAQLKFERSRDVILKLEMKCASLEKEIADHCLEAEKANEKIVLEKLEMEKARNEAQTLNEFLSATLGHRDLTLQKLRVQIEELERESERKNEDLTEQALTVSCLEKKIKESNEIHCNMEQHLADLKSQVLKTVEELKMSEEVKGALEEELKKSREEHSMMKIDLEGKLEMVHRDWSASCMRLKVATQQLDEESARKELLLKDLDLKESTLTELMEEKKILLVEKDALQQVVQVLEAKKAELMQEVDSSKVAINQLCNKYEVVQGSLASSLKEVEDLQAKLQNACQVGVQLLEAQEINRDLEGYLKAAKSIAQEKEEKLAASEWAVQQLALDVGKAKTALTLKDREEALIREELAEVERELRVKEGALIEMECYLEDALTARVSMHGEIQQLQQRMVDLDRGASDWKKKEVDISAQLEATAAALEGKHEVLIASELEVKRGSDLREVMKGAIESLKQQLADEQTALSVKQKDMNRLCEDLERTKGAAHSSTELVKELQGRLQQLDQSSEDRIKQFETTLSELKGALSVAHGELENYQRSTKFLTEESSQHKQKCEALLDLNGRKECILKELEAKFISIQVSSLHQSNILEQRDRELRFAKEQLHYQGEKQISLQESLSRIQSSRSELQFEKEELDIKLKELTDQLYTSSTELALKSKEIESLKNQVEQMRVILTQEGESKTLLSIFMDGLQSSAALLQNSKACFHNLKASLHGAQEEIQVLQTSFAGKDRYTAQQQSTDEQGQEECLEELSTMQEALALLESPLAEKSGCISSSTTIMDVETTALEGKGESDDEVANFLTQSLEAATVKAAESQFCVSEMQNTLDSVQEEFNENSEKLLLHLAAVEELQKQLKEWKEKSEATVIETLSLRGALEVAKVKTLQTNTIMGNLQEALESVEGEVSEFVLSLRTMQVELTEFREKESAAVEEGRHLRQQLEAAQKKVEFNQSQIFHLQQSLEKSGDELKETMEQNSNYISLSTTLQEEVFQWKVKVTAAERDILSLKEQLGDAESKGLEYHQEVLQLKDAMAGVEQALVKERKTVQRLTEEKNIFAESCSLISELRAEVEGWKTKAVEAVKNGENMKQELSSALITVSSLMAQVEKHQSKERSLEELNQRLQLDLTSAQDEAHARKEKIEFFLGQVEQSQKSEKELLAHLQMEHRKLITELESTGGFDCTFEIDDCHGWVPGKGINGEIGSLEKSQTYVEDSTIIATESLENELRMLRLQADEAQREVQQLSSKLEASLSHVATKNQIIKQVNDEIMGLRFQVRRLEEETLSLQQGIHGDTMQTARPLENEREDEQEIKCLGKRKAGSHEELSNYLELCDSLVRKNIRLEKQLEGLQRKNRGLQKQLEGLQMLEKASSEKERKPLDVVDFSPEQVPRGVCWKSNLNNVKSSLQDRKMFSLQDITKGKKLGEIDENTAPGQSERSQMSRRPPVSPAAIQPKKARRVADEV